MAHNSRPIRDIKSRELAIMASNRSREASRDGRVTHVTHLDNNCRIKIGQKKVLSRVGVIIRELSRNLVNRAIKEFYRRSRFIYVPTTTRALSKSLRGS